MSHPAPYDDGSAWTSPRQVTKARRSQANAGFAVYRHGLEAFVLSEFDRLDSQAAADATRAALDEELDLLDYGVGRAGQSPLKARLVARRVERFSAINDRRLTRRFG